MTGHLITRPNHRVSIRAKAPARLVPMAAARRLGGGKRGALNLVLGLCGLLVAHLPHAVAADQPAALKLRIVGGLAGVPQFTRYEEPFWQKELAALTEGRVSADVVPFNKAGIRTHEAMRLIQLGVVPFGTVLMGGVMTADPELAAPELAGVNPDMASLRRALAAFRPYLEDKMRERHGIEVLAVYTYPAQVTFCAKAFMGLSDLAGRRVRISNPTQADLIRPFGAVPVQTEFSEVVPNIRNGNVDCAITGGMSGNAIGLHEVTSHIHSSATTWGLSVFGANLAAWNALPAHVRTTLKVELPKLEQRIWADAEQQTLEGVACNTGQDTCKNGKPGRMIEVKASQQDQQKLNESLRSSVLPAWVERCGNECVPMWNRIMAPVIGIKATTRSPTR